ncbi:MAG: hypothetical protein PW999_00565 [Paraburkholderia tropica]|nr:hypothetical protein [Paraburkholderia tropica]
MRSRCTNPGDISYQRYGARGISVCERWDNFENFLADMGPRPTNSHSLEREDNNGNYEPGNCRWATAIEQSRNTRRNRMLTFDGRTQCVAKWADEIGIHRLTLQRRLRLGWSVEKTLSTPLALQFSHKAPR